MAVAAPFHRLSVVLILFLSWGCSFREPPPAPVPATEIASVREAAVPITGADDDYDALLELIGDNRFVLLGEQTHGTHEFYRERARITRRLIREKGFSAVTIEGNWQDAYRVNRYIRGLAGDATPEQSLASFSEFPSWMWRNAEMRDFVAWLREHNASRPEEQRVGFYGLDLYGVIASSDAVVASLEPVDPAAAAQARQRYRCFSRYRMDLPSYGRETAARPSWSCERGAKEQVRELEQRVAREAEDAPPARREELFSALQNARAVMNGEAYYRTLYQGGLNPWNLRDRHMTDVLDSIARYLAVQDKPPKIVVWAHNTHLGDARVTQMGEAGEHNVGQLMRQRHGGNAVLVGFTTYTGEVVAASNWGERGQVKRLRPALPESYSSLFHATGLGDFLLLLRGSGAHVQVLAAPRLERAVGVIYLPTVERRQHYFEARMARQFDAVIHLDETRAVEPLGKNR